MAFPVNSTSTMTDSIKRVNAVMGRSRVGSGKTRIIAYAGVFNCRKIAGSTLWSQHAYGNASDLFPTLNLQKAKCRDIADAVVYQAKHRTKANRFRKLRVAEVIDHENRRRWVPQAGWGPYTGSTGLHVHVSGSPFKSGTPACA